MRRIWWSSGGREHHPEQAGQIGLDLERLHTEVLATRIDSNVQQALAGEWQARLWRLVGADPVLVGELRGLLNEQLTPLLASADPSNTLTQTSTV
ncbi:hypothetical protein [Nocardia heshunensis]